MHCISESSLKIFSKFIFLFFLVTSSHASDVNINGFLSAHAGTNLESNANTYGYDDSIRYRPDTLAGIQITARTNSKMSATIQLVGRAKDEFEINAEWAFIEYKIDNNWSVQGGRIRIPWFAQSDYLDVKQTYHWTRAPQGVYSAPFNSFEGLKIRYQFEMSNWHSNLALTAGNYQNSNYVLSGSTLAPTLFDGKSWYSIAWNLTNETTRLFASVHSVQFTLEPENVVAGLQEISDAGYGDVADDIAVVDKQSYIIALGYFFDDSKYLLHGEWSLFDLDGYFSDQYSQYISAGKYFGDWLIHLTYEKDKNKPHNSLANPIPNDNPIKNTALDLLAAQKKENEVYSIGLKYDLDISTAFKVQYSYDKTNGQIGKVLTLGIDYVF